MGKPANPTDDIEYLEVTKVKAETDLALLCVFETGDEAWIPKSKIHDDSEVISRGDTGTLAIPSWLAKDKGLV